MNLIEKKDRKFGCDHITSLHNNVATIFDFGGKMKCHLKNSWLDFILGLSTLAS